MAAITYQRTVYVTYLHPRNGSVQNYFHIVDLPGAPGVDHWFSDRVAGIAARSAFKTLYPGVTMLGVRAYGWYYGVTYQGKSPFAGRFVA